MDPITLALMGGTALTSILGANEASQTAAMNRDISRLNYYAQQDAQRRQLREGRRQQSEAKLGTTDAAGNRTMFVPGRGWVTVLADDQQQLQDLTEAEQLRQLTDEASRNAERSERDSDRQGREDILATEAEREFRAARRPDEGSLRQLLLARGAETRNRAADRAGDIVARQNIRAGGRNAAQLMQSARAASDAASARQAGVDAELAARDIADQEFGAERGGAQEMYDYFRRMSTQGGSPVTGVTPRGPATRGSGQGDQTVSLALSRTPQLDYQSPNYAWESAGQGLIDMFASYRGLNNANTEANRVGGNQGRWQGIVN